GLQYFGLPGVRWLGCAVAILMIAEFIIVMRRNRAALRENRNGLICGAFLAWLFVMLVAVSYVGNRPWIMLLLLMIICGADIGAWLFGRILGGDKMWERLSSGKTWSGQIAGVACGTFMAVMYGLLGTDTFMPQLMWIGISIALLSQYGDLTASWVKRRIGIKDFGNIIPGHGGILDRFDGWIYALPLVWLIMM
ncbi:MAG: phosphatidate cytidylyltransferase, partial [Alphaproteobacteria bacterium]|nr:phosphatidate cytidylyltransferase [Alphaproteobacteria bacterium]